MQDLSLKLSSGQWSFIWQVWLFFFLIFNGNDLQLCHAVVLNCARRFDLSMFSFRSLKCTQKNLVSGMLIIRIGGGDDQPWCTGILGTRSFTKFCNRATILEFPFLQNMGPSCSL